MIGALLIALQLASVTPSAKYASLVSPTFSNGNTARRIPSEPLDGAPRLRDE